MCDKLKGEAHPRRGSKLEHGCAHGQDHTLWSRRNFLTALGMAAATGTISLAGAPVRAFARTPEAVRMLAGSDRKLVLLQLEGGNDGLNTIVQVDNDLYYQYRPTISVAKTDAVALADGLGLHPGLEALSPLYQDGKMAILHNVGYPDANLSHFRSTDIWLSASDADVYDETGWVGRYMASQNPNYLGYEPDFPLAVQVGQNSMVFESGMANMGMSIANEHLFERMAARGEFYNVDGLPQTLLGDSMEFMRRIANDSIRYGKALQQSAGGTTNHVAYPEDSRLGEHLAIVSRLIQGDLGARVYLVTLNGFDTHAEQESEHPLLMRELGDCVSAFMADLEAAGEAEDVLVMTFSEFGRTIHENGAEGTDHGKGAPLFLFGSGVNGGLYGSVPDISNPDNDDSYGHETDFRDVYTTVLRDWFGATESTLTDVLAGGGAALPVIASAATGDHTGIPVPDAPALITPDSDAAGLYGTIVLSWQEPDASKYAIQVARDAGFSDLVVDVSDLRETTYSLELAEEEAEWHWRVRGVSAGGVGEWSVPRVFTTAGPNVAPILAGVLPALSYPVGSARQLIDLAPLFTDPEGEALSFAASSSNTGVVTASAGTGQLDLEPVAPGEAVVTVVATDPRGGSVTGMLTVSITNQGPVLTTAFDDLELFDTSDPLAIDLSARFSDPEGQALSFGAQSSDQNVVAVQFPGSDSISLEPQAAGSVTITVSATDPFGLLLTTTFSVVVTASNQAPVVVTAPSAVGLSVVSAPQELDLAAYFSDPDGEPLTFGVSNSDTSVVSVALNGRTLTLDPVGPGTATLGITAADPQDASASTSFDVTVLNEAPTVTGTLANISLIIGGAPLVTDLASLFEDPEGQDLTIVARTSSAVVGVGMDGTTLTVTPQRKGSAQITVSASDPHGAAVSVSFMVSVPTGVGIEQIGTDIPTDFEVGANYPNPFNPETTFEFALPESAAVDLRVFDLAGRQVARVASGTKAAGRYRVRWRASALPSGTYLYRFRAGRFVETRQMVLLK